MCERLIFLISSRFLLCFCFKFSGGPVEENLGKMILFYRKHEIHLINIGFFGPLGVSGSGFGGLFLWFFLVFIFLLSCSFVLIFLVLLFSLGAAWLRQDITGLGLSAVSITLWFHILCVHTISS